LKFQFHISEIQVKMLIYDINNYYEIKNSIVTIWDVNFWYL